MTMMTMTIVMMKLALMLLVTFNDLGAFGVWKSLAGLIG